MEFEKININSKMPKSRIIPLFLDDLKISNTAKILYCRLLDAARNSHTDAFIKNISLAIEYRIWEMAIDLNCSQSTIKRALNTLEDVGLIKRIRKTSGISNEIYVMLPTYLSKPENKVSTDYIKSINHHGKSEVNEND